MKRFLITSATTLGLVSGGFPALAQSDAIQSELVKGASYAQSNNADAAEKAFQKAYDGAMAINDQARACQAGLQLAIVKTSLHKTAEAEKLFQSTLQIANKAMQANAPFTALVNCLLADLYLTENRPADAEKLYEAGIPNLPANPPTLAAEKTVNLAICYERGDKMQLAENTFEKSVATYKNIAGPDAAETMQVLANFAAFQYDRGNDAKAAELARQVLQSKTEAKVVKASANNVLANVFDRQAEYGKAMHIAQQSYDEFKSSQSTDAVREAASLLLMGRIYRDGHRYKQAEVTINKGLDLLAKAAPGSADFSDALREKGVLFTLQGQYKKAEDLLNQSKDLRTKFLGSESSDVAQNYADLGYVYQQQNKLNEAETAYKNSLRLYKQTRSETYVRYLEVLAKLSDLYKSMDRKADAESTLNKVLELQRQTLPANSPVITKTIVSLAALYKDDRQAPAAAKLLSEAVDRAQSSNADPAQKAGLLQDLASVQKAEGKTDQAAATNKKADALIGTLFGDYKTPASDTVKTAASAASAVAEKIPTGDKWCLCVGISNFKDTTINLKYSAKDATDFKNFLISKGHFKPDHVKLLVDESATRQNLIDQLGDGWLANHVKPEDLVVVYISSHGSQATDETNGVNFLVTYDTNKSSLLATGIPMQWLSKIIAEQVKCQRTVIMLDVCHSGSAADWSDESGSPSTTAVIASGSKGLQRMLTSDPQSVVPGAGQVILCSSSKSQTSWESQEYPNGVFTKRLMDALSANGPDTKLGDAYSVLKTNVEGEVLRDRGQLQTPQISGSGKGSLLSPLK